MQKNVLIMRERAWITQIDTTYCRKCSYNHYENIGEKTCQRCGEEK